MRLMLLLALAAAVALSTFVGAWWTVPLIGFAWGVWRRQHRRHALDAGIAAALGWAVLLGVLALRGPVLQVATQVAGVMGVPAAALLAVTLLLPFALGWSSARLGGALAGAVRRDAQATATNETAGRGSDPATRLTNAGAERVGAD